MSEKKDSSSKEPQTCIAFRSDSVSHSCGIVGQRLDIVHVSLGGRDGAAAAAHSWRTRIPCEATETQGWSEVLLLSC
ncbi:hypothetical protein AALO_G00085470 [Alosa alosa]|uniref:Uncharacterized protein n=1 Tax=Alosa alosa TaxID=278164 RepID=A0AAV6H289_9TELE|nr:hypothetical protein AALO_G00085470 [Alosa alosa]